MVSNVHCSVLTTAVKNMTDEKILAPYDIFEGLADVHDEVPYEDHSSPHSTINVPKPEAGDKSIIGFRKTNPEKI